MLSLVTGGAGFLGSHLVEALIEQGDRVIIVDDLTDGALRNIEGALRTGRAAFVYIDVARPHHELRGSFWEAARMKFIERIFHLPSRAGQNKHAPGARSVGELRTTSVVDLAMEHRARFIHVSTSWVYEDALISPRSGEHLGEHLDDATRCCEALISAAVARRGLDGRIVRLFNCYGPRMSKADSPLIAELAEAGGSGSLLSRRGKRLSTGSMIFVDDAIRLLLRAAAAEAPQLAPINIGVEEVGSASLTPLDEGLAKAMAWIRHDHVAYA